jgi:ssDNA-specific exonuclease RecJ
LEISENLPKLPTDVLALVEQGKNAEDLYFSMPSVIYTDIEENWTKFVAGAETRDEFTARYKEIFKNYANGYY